MITFELKQWAAKDELDAELAALNIKSSYSGFEDVAGYQMSIIYTYIEYIRFANEEDAMLFVLTYGDKYLPQKTNYQMKPGITPF